MGICRCIDGYLYINQGLHLLKGVGLFLKREYIDRSKLCFDGFNNKDS